MDTFDCCGLHARRQHQVRAIGQFLDRFLEPFQVGDLSLSLFDIGIAARPLDIFLVEPLLQPFMTDGRPDSRERSSRPDRRSPLH